jgi:ABC-2 type transport system permease protein
MSLKRIVAIFWARLKEFYRDRASLGWAILFPLLMVFGFSFMFKGANKELAAVGVVTKTPSTLVPLLKERAPLRVVEFQNEAEALNRLTHHKIDLLISETSQNYWLNSESPKSQVALGLWRSAVAPTDQVTGFNKQSISAKVTTYAEWAFPGILGMNVMFSALFGVGWVIVHYRKTKVLRRLKVTPLTAAEFLFAQILARLVIVALNTAFVFFACSQILSLSFSGSYPLLALTYALGALSLISIGVFVSARTASEELASGLINVLTWPMMLLSEVWFSLEGLPKWVDRLAMLMPLTHLNRAVRSILNDNAGLTEIAPHLAYMTLVCAVFLVAGSLMFKWEAD